MKKIILIAALAAILCSCHKDEIGDWSFGSLYNTNIKTETRQEVIDGIVEKMKEYDFFKSNHTYHGRYSDCIDSAATQFYSACDSIGDIDDSLLYGEFFNVLLICIDNGVVICNALWSGDPPAEE